MRASCVHASPGLVFHAINGIETALLDAIGKRYKLPIWQILGGKYRDHVRIYADCHAGEGARKHHTATGAARSAMDACVG